MEKRCLWEIAVPSENLHYKYKIKVETIQLFDFTKNQFIISIIFSSSILNLYVIQFFNKFLYFYQINIKSTPVKIIVVLWKQISR